MSASAQKYNLTHRIMPSKHTATTEKAAAPAQAKTDTAYIISPDTEEDALPTKAAIEPGKKGIANKAESPSVSSGVARERKRAEMKSK